jgi:hemolysin activation/secretion protein
MMPQEKEYTMAGIASRKAHWPAPAGSFVLLVLSASVAQAQVTPPDAGQILRETRPPAPAAPLPEKPPITVPVQPRPGITAPAPGAGEVRVQVTHFTFAGNSAIESARLSAAVAEWENRSLNFGDLMQAVEKIEAVYKAAGFILAQAYLPPQKIKDGAVEIAIAEGKPGEVKLEGESRVSPDVVFAYFDTLSKERPITLPDLERRVLLVNDLAGGKAALDLQAGAAEGTSDIILAQTEESLWSGRVDLNNYGAPSTGEKRLGVAVNAASLFHLGERINANILDSEKQGIVSYGLRGELPVGGNGWRVHAAASLAEYQLGANFAALDASGSVRSVRAGASYPFVRSRTVTVRLQGEVDSATLVDRYKAAGTELDKKSQGVNLNLSTDWLDTLGGSGVNRIDLGLRRARLELGDTALAADVPPAGLDTQGNFTKLTLAAQRQQYLNDHWSLIGQFQYQAASKNLDTSEKIAIGGALNMPGYVTGEATGDDGAIAKLNLRWRMSQALTFGLFTEYATLRIAHNPLASATTPNRRHFSDSGVNADWAIGKGFSASLIVAWAHGEKPNPQDNDRPRIWGNIGWEW